VLDKRISTLPGASLPPEEGKFFSIAGPEKSSAHGDKPDSAQSAASRITIVDVVAHLVDWAICHELFDQFRGGELDAITRQVAELIKSHQPCVALTGAGVSAESGIPTFRSKGGLWETFDPAVYASIDVFRQDPSKYWSIRGEFIRNYDRYRPNPGHLALAELERLGLLHQVITQNIDGLHRKAGSRDVIELHGSLREIFCVKCHREYHAPHVPEGMPPRCECGGVLKPNTVLFGESLPRDALETAWRAAQSCRVMLVIGTSAVVQPAASLPHVAKEGGAAVIEINVEQAFSEADWFLEGKSGEVLPWIVAHITGQNEAHA
jgi:NAD-dependent deacetylase